MERGKKRTKGKCGYEKEGEIGSLLGIMFVLGLLYRLLRLICVFNILHSAVVFVQRIHMV